MKGALDFCPAASFALAPFPFMGGPGLPNYAHADLRWTEVREIDHGTTSEDGVGKTWRVETKIFYLGDLVFLLDKLVYMFENGDLVFLLENGKFFETRLRHGLDFCLQEARLRDPHFPLCAAGMVTSLRTPPPHPLPLPRRVAILALLAG